MTKFYVDTQGIYLGGFDGVDPPSMAVLVANPPEHGLDKWDGVKWVKPTISALEKRALLTPLSAWQVRKVLTQFNRRLAVEAAVAASDQATKDAFNHAVSFERPSPLINGMAQLLGWTDEQVDKMFEIGATL